MTRYVIGKGDQFAFSHIGARLTALSKTIVYTHPSLLSCYSHYGFALSLDQCGVPLHVAVDGKFPIASTHVTPHHPIKRYLLIDHNGQAWKVLLQPNEDNQLLISYAYLDLDSDGWWLTSSENGERADENINFIQGFLFTNPSVKKIEEFWSKYHLGQDLTWLSINQIVDTLHASYPKKKKKPINIDELVDKAFDKVKAKEKKVIVHE